MNIERFIIEHVDQVRMGVFLGMLVIMAAWELFRPRRQLTVSKPVRWINNLGLVFLNGALVKWLLPVASIGVAAIAAQRQWGLFNLIEAPHTVAIIASIVILDFIIWLQHVMVHAIPLLWRLHRVHHADLDYDVTTGARFHPVEILLSMLIKFTAIVLIGVPVIAVIVFEILLNATAMFNHANIRLPRAVDRVLRWFVVTPDMHRVHHSIEDDETNSNFGFNLPWWDRLFGTYKDQPDAGHEGMTIGIRSFRDARRCSWLDGMLAIPFIGKISGYAINRRRWDDGNSES
jgi:sterol desaturase/sphingolipid hydroxylase (fatty acid hydroxylase superfamily)